MADRYATNQFYNFGNYEPGIGKASNRTTQDNPKFIWPNNVNKNAVVGPSGTTTIQRGYMKMITSAYGDSLDKNSLLHNRRLHFQFNPDTLTRMVSARNDIQMWQNQDPFQFTQPIPGDANFSFDLLFNREAELVSSSYRDENGKVVKNNKAASISREIIKNTGGGHPSRPKETTVGFEDNPYSQAWVTDIGVLADLMVFDQIIGQGMNQGLIEAIVKRAEDVTTAYNLANPGGGTEDEEDKEIPFDKSKTEIFLGTNIGNSAFLIAQPIRVVFSSSFMVEGFVTSTAVVFNKFNTAMVPTQCQISVQMQAMYIGFANKDTYLTTLYKDYDANTAFGVTATSTGTASELVALNRIGDDLVKSYIAHTAFNSEDLRPSRLLGKEGSVMDVYANAMFSESTKNFAKDKKGTITPYMRIEVTYLGRTSGPLPPNLAYNENEVFYKETVSGTVDMSRVSGSFATLKFQFEKPKESGLTELFDRDEKAKYKIKVTVFFRLETNVSNKTALQVGEVEKELTYSPSTLWIFGKDLKMKLWSQSQVDGIPG
jgi:hypothetical protein